MKKLLIFPLLIAVAMMFYSCDESTTDPVVSSSKGSIFLQSTPVGAQIWINGANTGKVTPDTVKDRDSGNVTVTLKLAGYKDTTFTVKVIANQVRSVATILTQLIDAVKFGPIRVWETTGTTAAQPSGLVLSTGTATSSGDNAIDVYYSSNGFKVKSSTANGNPRETFFKDGNATNLNDGVSSPEKDATWVLEMADNATNYFFLKDADGKYTKFQITTRGGGAPGNPAWVEVTYWYNKTVGDKRFPTN